MKSLKRLLFRVLVLKNLRIRIISRRGQCFENIVWRGYQLDFTLDTSWRSYHRPWWPIVFGSLCFSYGATFQVLVWNHKSSTGSFTIKYKAYGNVLGGAPHHIWCTSCWRSLVRIKEKDVQQLPGAKRDVEIIEAILRRIEPLTGRNTTKRLDSVAFSWYTLLLMVVQKPVQLVCLLILRTPKRSQRGRAKEGRVSFDNGRCVKC